jgi:predicted metal-dependent phosphoesterase TrpH
MRAIEVSCREGHFLVYGIDNVDFINPGMRAENLIKSIHGNGGIVIVAHPASDAEGSPSVSSK